MELAQDKRIVSTKLGLLMTHVRLGEIGLGSILLASFSKEPNKSVQLKTPFIESESADRYTKSNTKYIAVTQKSTYDRL